MTDHTYKRWHQTSRSCRLSCDVYYGSTSRSQIINLVNYFKFRYDWFIFILFFELFNFFNWFHNSHEAWSMDVRTLCKQTGNGCARFGDGKAVLLHLDIPGVLVSVTLKSRAWEEIILPHVTYINSQSTWTSNMAVVVDCIMSSKPVHVGLVFR